MNYARTIEKHVDVSIFRTRTGRQKCRGSKVRCPARSTTLTAALARLCAQTGRSCLVSPPHSGAI